MNSRTTILIFSILFVYLAFVGLTHQPAVHYFYDASVTRNTGLYLSYIPFTWRGIKDFIVALLQHVDGPLYYLVLNIYSYIIYITGDLLPINPATSQFPNTILFIACAFLSYLIGEKLHSRKLGLLAAAVFTTMPWIGVVVRSNVYLQSLSVFAELLSVYFYTLFFLGEGKKRNKILAPLALALFFTTGLDWPTFIMFLVIYAFLGGKLKTFVFNVYNLFPITIVSLHTWWFFHAHAQGGTVYYHNVLFKPFRKVLGLVPSSRAVDLSAFLSFDNLTKLATSYGLTVIVAFIGVKVATSYLRPALASWRSGWADQDDDRQRLWRSLMIAGAVWFLIAMFFIVLSLKGNHFYAYVVTIPLVFLVVAVIERIPRSWLAAFFVTAICFQGYATVYTWNVMFVRGLDDRRVLAASAYILEHRPDLLEKSKTAFLPRRRPANVGQYAGGVYRRILMPAPFPVFRKVEGNFPLITKELLGFVEDYENEGRIGADWLVLTPEVLTKVGKVFYTQVFEDEQIYWVANLRDAVGREIWIGEITNKRRLLSEAPVIDAELLADIYTEKYDRVGYLIKDLDKLIRF